MCISVVRRDIKFVPDATRIIARFLNTDDERAFNIIRSVMNMPDVEATKTLNQVLRDYSLRHRNISKIFEKHFNKLKHLFPLLNVDAGCFSSTKKALIGSYFTMEYSIEASAIFNPSMVEHPDQSKIGPGEKRVIISLRATGEGHISSIVFRTGILDMKNNLIMESSGKLLEEAEHILRHTYKKKSFKSKLDEMDVHSIIPSSIILDKLNEKFTYEELRKCIEEVRKSHHLIVDKEFLLNHIIWLASSHYELQFSIDTNISERVIFPVSDMEKNGIEDARFVKFTEKNKPPVYYATYTAYDGISILPKLLSTEDFYHFKILPLHGDIVRNKGMALFPRKVNGKYAMLCRIDGVNNYISYSDKITIWREAKFLQQPKFPWEFIRIGNCGSPIETDEGWLLLTHGVGPMREYVLGASLLDLHNPEIEIGRLEYPLIVPNTKEREGYVPNVIYSCGSIINNGELIIPYAMSDYASTYATINLRDLLDQLKTQNGSGNNNQI